MHIYSNLSSRVRIKNNVMCVKMWYRLYKSTIVDIEIESHFHK